MRNWGTQFKGEKKWGEESEAVAKSNSINLAAGNLAEQ